jgi:hypothetical protein
MGSIDSFKYPEHDIEKAVEMAELIHNKGISKPELFAEQLGHSSAEGGAFRNKLTALRRYGLISGRGNIELTSLAKKIVSPKPNSTEREEAIAKAVLNVELLDKLYKRLDCDTPDDDFWFQIVEITDSERSEAKNKSSDVQDLYESGLKYVEKYRESNSANGQSGHKSKDAKSKAPRVNQPDTDSVPGDAKAIFITPDARIDIRNQATFEAAKALFNDVGRKIEQADSDTSASDESL